MAGRRAGTTLTVVILGGAFLAGFLAMSEGAGPGWLAAARRVGGASPAEAAGGGQRLLPSSGRSSFVVLATAMPAHPEWTELTELTAEVEREQRSLAAEQAAEAAIARQAQGTGGAQEAIRTTAGAISRERESGRGETRAALQATYARRWEAERARLLSEADQKVAARRAVLAAQVDERIGVKRGELKTALSERIDAIRRQREARLLSLQLQLGLRDKDPAAAARASALQEELSQVRAEIDREVKAAQKETEDQLAAYAREVEEAAGRDLRVYAAELAAEAERQAETARQALDRELAERLRELDGNAPAGESPAGGGTGALKGGSRAGSASPANPPTPLQLRRNALSAAIIADVRRTAGMVASQRGLAAPQLVGTEADRPAAGVDLTTAVADLLTNRSER